MKINNFLKWNFKKITKEELSLWLNPCKDSFYLIHRWKNNEFKKVLDLGCGLGRHAILFAQSDFKVLAIDTSAEVINYLEAKSKEMNLEIDCTVGSADMLQLEDASVDAIMLKSVIMYNKKSEVESIFKELYRVLKPGGEAYVTLPSKCSAEFKNTKSVIYDRENILIEDKETKQVVYKYFADEQSVNRLVQKFELISLDLVQDFYVQYEWLESSSQYQMIIKKPI